MLKFVILAVVLVTVLATTRQEDDAFNAFMSQYNKVYKPGERSYRKRVFLDNLNLINKHNEMAANNSVSYTLAVNEFTDMENEEFVSVMNGYRMDLKKDIKHTRLYKGDSRLMANLPLSVDWRTKGYVSGVKNQGGCGACWAFSATGALEGQHFNATGLMVSLSEQDLIDCSQQEGTHGCWGGTMLAAFQYVIDNEGIDTEKSYPYEATTSSCRYHPKSVGSTCSSYVRVSESESDLQAAVAEIGPISVGIDASHSSFRHYHSGVYFEPYCDQYRLDHAVLVVGYGTFNGKQYWLVKNSWGESWGQKGYIWMARNRNNNCGIATDSSFPIVNKN